MSPRWCDAPELSASIAEQESGQRGGDDGTVYRDFDAAPWSQSQVAQSFWRAAQPKLNPSSWGRACRQAVKRAQVGTFCAAPQLERRTARLAELVWHAWRLRWQIPISSVALLRGGGGSLETAVMTAHARRRHYSLVADRCGGPSIYDDARTVGARHVGRRIISATNCGLACLRV